MASDLDVCRRRLEAVQQLLALRDEELRKLRTGSTGPCHASPHSAPALSSESEAEQHLQKGIVKQSSAIFCMLLVPCVLLLVLLLSQPVVPIVSAIARYLPRTKAPAGQVPAGQKWDDFLLAQIDRLEEETKELKTQLASASAQLCAPGLPARAALPRRRLDAPAPAYEDGKKTGVVREEEMLSKVAITQQPAADRPSRSQVSSDATICRGEAMRRVAPAAVSTVRSSARIFISFHRVVAPELVWPGSVSYGDGTTSNGGKSSTFPFVAYATDAQLVKQVYEDGRMVDLRDSRLHQLSHAVLEQDLPNYTPELQKRGFMETAAFVHVYRNRHLLLAQPGDRLDSTYATCIGFGQYDMIWPRYEVLRVLRACKRMPENATFALMVNRDNTAAKHRGHFLGGMVYAEKGGWHPMVQRHIFPMQAVLESYNRFFGTNHNASDLRGTPLTLWQTYVMHRNAFIKLGAWITRLSTEIWPWANMAPYPHHWGHIGGLTERANAIFVSLQRLEVWHLGGLQHSPQIGESLNQSKVHHPGSCPTILKCACVDSSAPVIVPHERFTGEPGRGVGLPAKG